MLMLICIRDDDYLGRKFYPQKRGIKYAKQYALSESGNMFYRILKVKRKL